MYGHPSTIGHLETGPPTNLLSALKKIYWVPGTIGLSTFKCKIYELR